MSLHSWAARHLLRVLALSLLIAGFPFLLFGVFLAASPTQNGIEVDVALRLGAGGLVAVLGALGLKGYLRRHGGWL